MDLKVMYIATLSILALTGYTQTQCIADSRVNGCSIPLGLPFYYKREFTPSCHKHDICYFCGQKYGWTRSECDIAFKRDMERACTSKFGKRKRSLWDKVIKGIHLGEEITKLVGMSDGLNKCRQAANVYYLSVDYFGEDNYANPSPSWCNDPCARERGSPF